MLQEETITAKARAIMRNESDPDRAETLAWIVNNFYRHMKGKRGEKPAEDINLFSEKPIAIEIVKMGFRKLALKYHPDIGGDKQKMQDLNRIKNKLLNNLSD